MENTRVKETHIDLLNRTTVHQKVTLFLVSLGLKVDMGKVFDIE